MRCARDAITTIASRVFAFTLTDVCPMRYVIYVYEHENDSLDVRATFDAPSMSHACDFVTRLIASHLAVTLPDSIPNDPEYDRDAIIRDISAMMPRPRHDRDDHYRYDGDNDFIFTVIINRID